MVDKNKQAPEGADSEEQSMEEILQSIRRIIADEEDETPAHDEMESSPFSAGNDMIDDDVLVLTEEMPDERRGATADASSTDSIDFDKLFGDDPLLDGPAEEAPQAAAHEEEDLLLDDALSLDEEDDVLITEGYHRHQSPGIIDATDHHRWDDSAEDLLVSEATAAATIEALKAIKNVGAEKGIPAIESRAFRSGVTVEDLVVEALRPMLKEWLDSNLPTIVEQVVQKEVRKLAAVFRD